MKTHKLALSALLLMAATAIHAQGWVRPYERALNQGRAGEWQEAKKSFQEAIKNREDDTDKSSSVGGAVADRKPWRNGSPYSPNFGVAYATFKIAAESQDVKARQDLLQETIAGLESLIAKGQESMEALVFLAASYAALNNTQKASEVQERVNALTPSTTFRVDQEIIELSDMRAIQGIRIPSGGAATGATGLEILTPGIGSKYGLVPILDNKFALVVGNSQGSGQSFAENDVDLLRDALVRHAGYADSNVVVIKNGTKAQILDQARALADKLPESAIVFFFFSGTAVYNRELQRDYLLGIDATPQSSPEQMISKTGLYQFFINKASSIFAFYQVDRPTTYEGNYFGKEIPQVGRVAQVHSCSPGENSYGFMVNGKNQGVYAAAMADVLAQVRNNRIAILDFAWATFRQIRKGTVEGAGGAQTPTLPVVVSMTSTAKF